MGMDEMVNRTGISIEHLMVLKTWDTDGRARGLYEKDFPKEY